MGTVGPQQDKGAPFAGAVGQGPSSNNMLGLQWGAQASYSPLQAGLRGPRRIGQDPGVQLMVGVFWDGHCLPCLLQGWLQNPGSGVGCQGGAAFGCDSVGRTQGTMAHHWAEGLEGNRVSDRVPGCRAARTPGCTQFGSAL